MKDCTLYKSTQDLETDLHLSPLPISILIFGLGIAFFVAQDFVANPGHPFALGYLALLCYTVAGASGILHGNKPTLSRWLILIALQLILYLSIIWLNFPQALVLQFALAPLAVMLISIQAGLGVSMSASAMTLVVPSLVSQDISRDALVALGAIWIAFALFAAAYWQMRGVANWAWEQYHLGQIELAQARKRKEELKETLADFEKINQQLVRLNRLDTFLRHEADEARRVKEEFVANISHELRTPINMIIGFTKMIVDSPRLYGHVSAALLSDLAVIHRNAEQLSMLIDDVLDLSQVESGAMALIKEFVPANEVIEPAVEGVRPLFQSKGLYLKVDIQESLPPLFCDRTRIREVMLNLLANAGRFTDQGGVCVTARREGDNLLVAVTDTGRGIAEKDLSKLFQPFQQVDNSIRRAYGGTGLGLHISKRILELHHAKISVESKVNAGTTFTLQMPIAVPEPMRVPMGVDYLRGLQPGWDYLEPTRPKTVPNTQFRPRFVVLEPANVLQRILQRYLGDVELVAVSTLAAALEELEKQPSQALVINQVSAETTLTQMHDLELPRGTPALVCHLAGTDAGNGILDVADYLIKPVSQEKLLSVLEKLELRGNTVLLIEDNPDAAKLFRRMLTSLDKRYRVIRASNGEEGLRLLEVNRADAILLDLVMPKMDGFQFLEALRLRAEYRDVPVIVISARDPSGHPIVSKMLSVTSRNGLSVAQLVTCIKSLSQILSAPALPLGPRS